MLNKANMCILLHDETADLVYIDTTLLGPRVKLMKRLPRDESLYESVATLMRSMTRPPARVTLCLPRSAVMQRTLRYPAAVRDDIGSMIQLEATRHVPLPDNDRALAWSAVPSPDNKQLALNLVAGRRSSIRAFIRPFEKAGVPIDEALPLSSAVSQALAQVPTLLVIADMQSIELSLYGEGQLQESLVLKSDADDGPSARVVSAARQMTVRHKGWLGDEGIGRIFLTGCTSSTPDTLGDDLGTAFGLHSQALPLPESIAGTAPADPLVEALWLATSEFPPKLNLKRAKTRKIPISKRAVLVTTLCLVLALELVAGFTLYTLAPARQRKEVARELSALRRQSTHALRMKERNRDLRKQISRMEDIQHRRTSVMRVLAQISETLPDDTYLRTVSYTRGEGLQLSGYSMEPERLPELVETIPLVDMISTSHIGKEINDYHDFKLTITLRSSDEEDDA